MTPTAQPEPVAVATILLGLPDPAATDRLGAALGGVLRMGDVVLLSGPLGAGKSALARAVIATRIADPAAHIPSPSYTLVNVYEAADGPIWHADLYRLGGDDLDELGLDDAYAQALVLIEWPERLGMARPWRSLELVLAPQAGGRQLRATATGPGWEAVCAVLEAAR